MSAIGKTILGDSTSMQDPEKGAQTIVLDGDDNELASCFDLICKHR